MSDGTAAGTHLLRDIGMRDTSAVANTGSRPGELTALGGRILFTFTDGFSGSGLDLWTSDGTAAGTRLVREIPSEDLFGTSRPGLVGWRNRVFFSLQRFSPGVGVTPELWASDGSPAGTRKLAQVESRFSDPLPQVSLGFGRNLFMLLPDGLWKSDGTPEGTVRVSPVGRALNSGTSGAIGALPGSDLLRRRGLHGRRAVEERRHRQRHRLSSGTSSRARSELRTPPSCTPAGGLLFFHAITGEQGAELWRSDGTEAGTVLVADIAPGQRAGSDPRELTAVGGRSSSPPDAGDVGSELWRSDGTAAGTVLVKDLAPGERSSFPARADGRRRLRCSSPPTTASRPRAVEERRHAPRAPSWCATSSPGRRARHRARLTAAGSTLFFAAADAQHGLEPWQSDGTAEGTALSATSPRAPPLRTRAISPSPGRSSSSSPTTTGTAPSCGRSARRRGRPSPWSTPACRRGGGAAVPMSFRVSLSGPFCVEVRVNYATQPGTATPGIDYTPASGTLVFPPGTTSLAVPVPVRGDRLAEPDETLFLRLARPENATLARRRARGLILDDDRR